MIHKKKLCNDSFYIPHIDQPLTLSCDALRESKNAMNYKSVSSPLRTTLKSSTQQTWTCCTPYAAIYSWSPPGQLVNWSILYVRCCIQVKDEGVWSCITDLKMDDATELKVLLKKSSVHKVIFLSFTFLSPPLSPFPHVPCFTFPTSLPPPPHPLVCRLGWQDKRSGIAASILPLSPPINTAHTPHCPDAPLLSADVKLSRQ